MSWRFSSSLDTWYRRWVVALVSLPRLYLARHQEERTCQVECVAWATRQNKALGNLALRMRPVTASRTTSAAHTHRTTELEVNVRELSQTIQIRLQSKLALKA